MYSWSVILKSYFFSGIELKMSKIQVQVYFGYIRQLLNKDVDGFLLELLLSIL